MSDYSPTHDLMVMGNKIKDLEKEIERLRTDAERYQWLRNDTSPYSWCAINNRTPEEIDSIIDAVMKK